MEAESQIAPSVVSVMVVHEPGDWFETTLHAVAAQDYRNFPSLFLLTARGDQFELVADRIRAVLPAAFIRQAIDPESFGASVNDVLRLVDGDNGFFLICHDDIAPAPDAVRMLVAEMFRSNAGIVGPKLLDWDNPRQLQHVGLGLDRLGELDSLVEPGEVDQEQHDAVRDVFVIPSACMLVRADLFRTLGGFDPAISFYGEDVDLCWRAHHTGARVIVVPDAEVRHRERLDARRDDLPHRAMKSRHRMRMVATLTGSGALLMRSLQMVAVTLVELVVGLFTGRFGEALASLRALVGLIPRTGSLLARRRAIAAQRIVPEREIIGLQVRGSSRLTSYLRGRDTTTYVGEETTVRRWRQASYGPLLAWFVVLAGVIIGSRQFITDGVPPVGEFLAFPESARDLWSDFASPFDGRGLGATAAVPTGWGTLAAASVLTLFKTGLFQTMFTIGLFIVGGAGAWRLGQVFPVNRARIAAMVVYVGTPLVPGLLGRGDLSALVWFAALPWLVHHLRRVAGLEPADPDAVGLDLADGVAPVGPRHRIRAAAAGVLIAGLAASIVPATAVLLLGVGLALTVGTLLALGNWRVAGWMGGGSLAFAAGAYLLNLPWSLSWSWEQLAGVPTGATGRDLADIASLAADDTRFGILGVTLFVPMLAALAITRAWRFTWSVRALLLVIVFGGAAIVSEFDLFGPQLPRTTLLYPAVALGLALGAAALVGGFGADVTGRDFGWRQPIGVLANAALIIGLVPAAVSVGNGHWNTDSIPLVDLLNSQFQSTSDSGEYRVLYVGHPDVMPVPGHGFGDGLEYAVVDAGPLTVTDRFATPHTRGNDAIESALQLISEGSTLRAGRVLAPLGVRYIVVPESTRVTSTAEEAESNVPSGLLEAFANQLDMGRVEATVSVTIYRNQSYIPTAAVLNGSTAETSRRAGAAILARADTGNFAATLPGADDEIDQGSVTGPVEPGVLQLAVPFDSRLGLEVDGTAIDPRPGFGVSTVFDVDTGGTATVTYDQDSSRQLWLILLAVLWFAVALLALSPRTPFARRRHAEIHDETLIDFGDEPDSYDVDAALEPVTDVPIDPGLADITTRIVREDPS